MDYVYDIDSAGQTITLHFGTKQVEMGVEQIIHNQYRTCIQSRLFGRRIELATEFASLMLEKVLTSPDIHQTFMG